MSDERRCKYNIIDPYLSSFAARKFVDATRKHALYCFCIVNDSIFENGNRWRAELLFLSVSFFLSLVDNFLWREKTREENWTIDLRAVRFLYNPHEETELLRRSFDRPLFIGHVLIDDEALRFFDSRSWGSTINVTESLVQAGRKEKCKRGELSKKMFENHKGGFKGHKPVSYTRNRIQLTRNNVKPTRSLD